MFEELITKAPPLFFKGLQVFVVKDTPRMQLSEDCPVTPAMREETNAWMRDFFGMTNVLADGLAYHDVHRNCLFCNPRTMASIRSMQQAQQDRAAATADKPARPMTAAQPRKKVDHITIGKRISKYRKPVKRR